MSDPPPRGVVGLLTAQALAFGVTLALLIIPANALFLDAYGSEWLPATYIAIAVFGSGASALIARAARRTRLVRVADSDPRSARRALRGVLADPHRGRRLGVGGPPRAVPDRAPAGVRLHRRTGRQAARRPADEGAVPSRRVGIRRRDSSSAASSGSPSSPCSGRPSTCCSPPPQRSSRSSASSSRPSGDSRRCAPRPPRTRRRSPGHRCGRSSPRASSSSSSSTRCCPRWARRWSTSSCSTAPQRNTAGTT